jgi:hypothetical protein
MHPILTRDHRVRRQCFTARTTVECPLEEMLMIVGLTRSTVQPSVRDALTLSCLVLAEPAVDHHRDGRRGVLIQAFTG